jgi:hypothetical protein
MPTVVALATQRTGINSRLIIIPETYGSEGQDPGSPEPFVFPLADESGYEADQAIEEAPVYTGSSLTPDVVDMNFEAGGTLPAAMEFTTIKRLLRLFFGPSGVVEPEGPSGDLVEFVIPTTMGSRPQSFQVADNFMESTAQYQRSRYNIINTISFPFATAGQGKYNLEVIGIGDLVETASGGTVVDDGYTPMSYFNTRMIVNDIVVAGLTNFDDSITCGAQRTEVGANQGKAGGITTGFYKASGSMATIYAVDGSGVESNNYLYNLWKNKTQFVIECIYTDLPLEQATQFFRRRYLVRISRPKRKAGGNGGKVQEFTWQTVRGGKTQASAITGTWEAENFGANLGPFTVPATSNLGVKIDGAATLTIPITAGSRTTDQVVTELNAHVGFTAVATAENFLGRIMIKSKTKGSATSKVQIDTAVSNSLHTLFGFTATIYTGKGSATSPVPVIYQVYS